MQAELMPSPMMFSGPNGISTPFGVWLPAGSRVVAYVRGNSSGNVVRSDFEKLPGGAPSPAIYATIAQGCAQCQSGYPDVVMVLPGHAENMTAAAATALGAAIKAGTRIVGPGMSVGSLIPTLTWTATAASLAITTANVMISGLKFAMQGANDITKGINWTGAGGAIVNCDFDLSTATDLHAAIGLEIGTAAHNFRFLGNRMLGTSDAVTDAIKVAGVANGVLIANNWIDVNGPAATTGIVNVTAAALRLAIINNDIANRTASSDFALAFGDVACSGFFHDNRFYVLNNNADASTDGVSLGTAALVQGGQNWCSNLVKENGKIAPAASG